MEQNFNLFFAVREIIISLLYQIKNEINISLLKLKIPTFKLKKKDKVPIIILFLIKNWSGVRTHDACHVVPFRSKSDEYYFLLS